MVPKNDENSSAAINERNRRIMYLSNNPDASPSSTSAAQPGLLDAMNNMRNDEASKFGYLALQEENKRKEKTDAVLAGAIKKLNELQGTETADDEEETKDAHPADRGNRVVDDVNAQGTENPENKENGVTEQATRLDSGADFPNDLPSSPESADDRRQKRNKKTEPTEFFRCCNCQYTSPIPNCLRPESGDDIQTTTHVVYLVTAACNHSKCSLCINVDKSGVRIGIKPWEMKWR